MVSRRVEMSIDVEELQMFDGIAQCANHTIEFKIGKPNQAKTAVIKTNFGSTAFSTDYYGP